MPRSILDSLKLYESSMIDINKALSDKLGGGTLNVKLSQVADKIREIELKPAVVDAILIVKITDNYLGDAGNIDGPEIMPIAVDPGSRVFVKVKKENTTNYLLDTDLYGGQKTELKITEAGNYTVSLSDYSDKQTATKTLSIKESGIYSVIGTPYGFIEDVGDLRVIITSSAYKNYSVRVSCNGFDKEIDNNTSDSNNFDTTFYNIPIGQVTLTVRNPGMTLPTQKVTIEKGKLITYEQKISDPGNPEEPWY